MIGNFTSVLPTIFWILKFLNLTLKPTFYMTLAYLLDAMNESDSDLAPVHTIFPIHSVLIVDMQYNNSNNKSLPLENIRAVVLGALILIITAANLLGLYSAFLHFNAIYLSSRVQSKFTVLTTFWIVGYSDMSILKSTWLRFLLVSP